MLTLLMLHLIQSGAPKRIAPIIFTVVNCKRRRIMGKLRYLILALNPVTVPGKEAKEGV
jgi:hypothetical protein